MYPRLSVRTKRGSDVMKLRHAAGALIAFAALLGVVSAGAQSRSTLTPAAINQMIQAEWKQHDIVPATPVDDARFLRRIYLDIVGTIPPAQVVSDFLADK